MNQAFQLGHPDNLARQVAVYATRVSARRGLVFKEVDATVAFVGRYVAMVHEGKSVDAAGKYVMGRIGGFDAGVAADFLSILTEDGTYTPPGMRRPVRIS